ncbi:hypothetical protein LCGC14_1607210 [marine sediment metagenome]|uniref:Uncharacterized protein n=1 Tax=marine sediment metagenome TaxID=412755 RepID=A0A0F9I9F1_9ZZZZ
MKVCTFCRRRYEKRELDPGDKRERAISIYFVMWQTLCGECYRVFKEFLDLELAKGEVKK